MIDLASIYKGFWKCRDLEIQMLWTRLTLLGGLIALTYTGYGVLLINEFEHCRNWQVFNLLGVGACCFGIVFSVLWTITAKGSKFWYEYYEKVIEHFQRTNEDLFEKDANGDRILSYLDFKNEKIDRPDVNNSLWSAKCGTFSVSKIPIALGQVSMLAWGALIVLHGLFLFLDQEQVKAIAQGLALKIAAFCAIVCVLAVSCICAKVKSGFLEERKN